MYPLEKATLLNPTEEDETIQVLRRRLFESIDDTTTKQVADAYRLKWSKHGDELHADASRPEVYDLLVDSYPFHPDVLDTLTSKTATLNTFQRVRGMLRLLARTVANVWHVRPNDATCLHVHHIDPGINSINQEIVTRLGQSHFSSAISNDVSGKLAGKDSLAEAIDLREHNGLPPYASYVARTVFMHTLAFNEPLKGIQADRLRYSILGPFTDISFVESARKKFAEESAYLDDRPGVPMRFLAEANLTQIVRGIESNIDANAVTTEINDRIRTLFDGSTFETVVFPAGPQDVPDDIADGKPRLAVIGQEALAIDGPVESAPDLIKDIYEKKGAQGIDLRINRNNLVFVVADESGKESIRRQAARFLAIEQLANGERRFELAEHQQSKLRELESNSETALAIAVQQCYRHLFYPSQNRLGTSDVMLDYCVVEAPSAAERPGHGQRHISRRLSELRKIRLNEDEPDSPTYIRDRTPLRTNPMTTYALREEFRRNPALPILIGDDVYIRLVKNGIQFGEYIYERGDLIYGSGEPVAEIRIDEQATVFTIAQAKEVGIWPRKTEDDDATDEEESGDESESDPPKTIIDKGDGFRVFNHEGEVGETLKTVLGKASAIEQGSLTKLEIKMWEAEPGFSLLRALNGIPDSKKHISLECHYKTESASTFDGTFEGTVEDAEIVQEFVRPQLRSSSSPEFYLTTTLEFEPFLKLSPDNVDKTVERLSRFVEGEAHVAVTVKTEPS